MVACINNWHTRNGLKISAQIKCMCCALMESEHYLQVTLATVTQHGTTKQCVLSALYDACCLHCFYGVCSLL